MPSGRVEAIQGLFFRVAASGLVPARWFRDPIPPESARRPGPPFPKLEIVSHCWNYAYLLVYQLSSIINYPPTKLTVTVTVFHAAEDADTVNLLEFIGRHAVPNVIWNWQQLPREQLFRRGIGRNRAALSTQADWVWMTDCDIIFHKGCLDSTADQLCGRTDILLFPRQERTTEMLPDSNSLLIQGRACRIVDIESSIFNLHSRDRAKGAFQIIHGDVARAIGYCDGIRLYQTAAAHWCKCYEDRIFRWLVGAPGVPLDIEGVYQIRHITKGRYRSGTRMARLRSKIRRMQEPTPACESGH